MWTYIKHAWEKTCAHGRAGTRMHCADIQDGCDAINEGYICESGIKSSYKDAIWDSVSTADKELINEPLTILSAIMIFIGGLGSWCIFVALPIYLLYLLISGIWHLLLP